MPIARPRSPSRAGFTLLELLIVLAILAMIMMMSWPAVGGLLAKNELRSAARQVRAVLAKTRLAAMESGTVHQFRFQPGTPRCEVARLAVEELPPPRAPQETGKLGGVSGESDETRLPSGVRWESPDTNAVPLPPTSSDEAPDEAWSTPILFFPNGRTSNARLQLGGRRGFRIGLSLRGVTGTVAIGNLQRAEEQP